MTSETMEKASTWRWHVALALVAVATACGPTRVASRPASTIPGAAEVLPPAPLGIELTLGALALDGKKLLDLAPLEEQVKSGFPAQWKASGPNDLLIVPLLKALETAPRRSVLALRLEPEVPYRMIAETLFTAGRAGYETFRLSIPASSAAPALDVVVRAPAPSGNGGPEPDGSSIAVFIVRDGLSVKLNGRNVAPGCEDAGAGLAVPGNTNFAALRTCLLRQRQPFDGGISGTVVANPGVPAWHVLAVAHVLRCGERPCPGSWQGPDLFDPIIFGVPR